MANHNKFLEAFWNTEHQNLKSWQIFSSFNPFPSMPSVATDDRKQFQYIQIVLNNKSRSLVLKFNWCEDTFWLFIELPIAWQCPFNTSRERKLALTSPVLCAPFKMAEHSFQVPMPNLPSRLNYLCFGARFFREQYGQRKNWETQCFGAVNGSHWIRGTMVDYFWGDDLTTVHFSSLGILA